MITDREPFEISDEREEEHVGIALAAVDDFDVVTAMRDALEMGVVDGRVFVCQEEEATIATAYNARSILFGTTKFIASHERKIGILPTSHHKDEFH